MMTISFQVKLDKILLDLQNVFKLVTRKNCEYRQTQSHKW